MKPRKSLFNPELRRRGIYLLPNLFTSAALFAGFFSIVMAMQGRFEEASIAIFVAMVLDGLDGRIARLTRTQSAFGAEFDSLSDMVSFGVAPALVSYEWAMRDLGRLGWIAAFVYCVSAALRLARFNTSPLSDKIYFQGLPSPAAAALVGGFVWVMTDNGFQGHELRYATVGLLFFAALSMVSNVHFHSFKNFNLRKSVPFIFVGALALAYVLIASYPPGVLFAIFVAYVLSGYLLALWRLFIRKKLPKMGE